MSDQLDNDAESDDPMQAGREPRRLQVLFEAGYTSDVGFLVRGVHWLSTSGKVVGNFLSPDGELYEVEGTSSMEALYGEGNAYGSYFPRHVETLAAARKFLGKPLAEIEHLPRGRLQFLCRGCWRLYPEPSHDCPGIGERRGNDGASEDP